MTVFFIVMCSLGLFGLGFVFGYFVAAICLKDTLGD